MEKRVLCEWPLSLPTSLVLKNGQTNGTTVKTLLTQSHCSFQNEHQWGLP